jgi:amidase
MSVELEGKRMKRAPMVGLIAALAAHAGAPAWSQPAMPGPFASGAEQAAALAGGAATSESLTQAALGRIQAMDHAGPRLNAVIAILPGALAEARSLDAERRAGRVRGPLQGLPILLKDNIEAAGGPPTTAGSLALTGNAPGRDSPIARRLREGGLVILGKTNLSEWANFRSGSSISGWSAVGGLVRNPYALDRSACGSSAGSGAAVAAGYVFAAIGTETDGSIICPSAASGLVGFKPTLGLVPRTGVVPLSPAQDTAGPMARTVRDAAEVLTLIAGSDPADPATAPADTHRVDFAKALDAQALKGARIGVLRRVARHDATHAVFEAALERMSAAGAVLVEIAPMAEAPAHALNKAETTALQGEFRASIDAYLAAAPAAVRTRSLDALIAFDKAEPAELALFGQDTFEAAAKTGAAETAAARAEARRLAGPEGLDRMFAEGRVDAIAAESGGPSAVIDLLDGDHFTGSPTTLPAVAGYPHLTVPMGQVGGMPVGLSLIGPAWSDARILSLGYAFEQLGPRLPPPRFQPSADAAFASATDR